MSGALSYSHVGTYVMQSIQELGLMTFCKPGLFLEHLSSLDHVSF